MTDTQREWAEAKEDLLGAFEKLGLSRELGEAVAKNLGSPKAMERMTAYLYYVKPKSEELVVDEMLAIRSEIEEWKKKKAHEETGIKMNRLLRQGFGDE